MECIQTKKHESKKLYLFFILAYGISGLFALPLILNLNLNSGNIFLLLMLSAQFGPFFSAFITTSIFDGKEGVKDLLRRATNIKLPWYVYVLTITVPVICMFSGVFLGASITKTTPALWVLVPTTVVTTITSPLGEEFGWRGIALPIMQKKLSPIMASLLLGIVWAGWHYWLFLVPGQFQNDLPFILFLAGCIGDSLWFTWFHNRSNASIFAAVFFHFTLNFTFKVSPINPKYFNGSVVPYIIMVTLELISGLIINLYFNKKIEK